MSTKLESFQSGLGRFAQKLSGNVYIQTIRDAMLAYLPFTVIASIFLILAYIPSDAINDFISNVINTPYEVWQGKLMWVHFASLEIAGLLVILTTGYAIAERFDLNRIQVTLTALVSYLVITPIAWTDAGPAYTFASLGAVSMFTAILVGLVTGRLYKLIDDRNIKIKMPESVPPAVSAPFEALIPSLVVILFFWIIALVMDGMGTDLNSFVNDTVGLPLRAAGGSVFGVMFAKTFEQLLWFFGIHGGSIVQGVMTPILLVLEQENQALVLAGEAPIHIMNNSFFTHFAGIGVVGAVIAALIVARSTHYRTTAKIAAGPYVFGVGEPALFGFPLMLNFKLFIPFVFTNIVVITISYLAFASGMVPIPTGLVQLPWTTPVILSGFLVTQSVAGSILQIVLLVTATVIWLPFMRIADKDVQATE